jgi:hypothetical protein
MTLNEALRDPRITTWLQDEVTCRACGKRFEDMPLSEDLKKHWLGTCVPGRETNAGKNIR